MINVEMLSTGDEVLHGQIIDTMLPGLPIFSLSKGLPVNAPQYGGRQS